MHKYAIIVAGGSGTRMKTDIPKQFLEIAGKPILMHTIEKFYNYDNTIRLILVLPEKEVSYWNQLMEKHSFTLPHEIAFGGQTRFQSVLNGLEQITQDSVVAIHDGVRPFVSTDTLKKCFQKAIEKGNGLPVVDMVESVRKISKRGNLSVDRTSYKLVQTPQIFQANQILDAYSRHYMPQYTDDASVVEEAGYNIHLVQGNRENIKITTPSDLLFAEAYIKSLE